MLPGGGGRPRGRSEAGIPETNHGGAHDLERCLGLFAALFTAFPLLAQGTGPVNDSGTTAWMLTSTTLVLLMVPGLALFFGWDSKLFLLRGIDHTILPAGGPEYAFAMFQGKFAILTPALIAGAVAERISFKGWLAFITLWVLFVYCPLCHWVWATDGYFFNLGAKGAIDFAGGTVVHISSGVGGLALALFLGARHGCPKTATA